MRTTRRISLTIVDQRSAGTHYNLGRDKKEMGINGTLSGHERLE
jgi:hypothetical protein